MAAQSHYSLAARSHRMIETDKAVSQLIVLGLGGGQGLEITASVHIQTEIEEKQL